MRIARNRAHAPHCARGWEREQPALTISPADLDRMLKAGQPLTVVDVREAEDFARGHVPGALSLPEHEWGSLQATRWNQTYVFYCCQWACHRAAQACVKFLNLGHPVLELEGGFAVWAAFGLEVEVEPFNRLESDLGRFVRCRY